MTQVCLQFKTEFTQAEVHFKFFVEMCQLKIGDFCYILAKTYCKHRVLISFQNKLRKTNSCETETCK